MVLCLVLAGCSEPRHVERLVAECQVAAAAAAHTDDVGKADPGYVVACMQAKGYDSDYNLRDCTRNAPPYLNPACYRPVR